MHNLGCVQMHFASQKTSPVLGGFTARTAFQRPPGLGFWPTAMVGSHRASHGFLIVLGGCSESHRDQQIH